MRHIVRCNFAVPHHSSLAKHFVAEADRRPAADNHRRNLAGADTGFGFGAGTAGSLGCTDRKGQT